MINRASFFLIVIGGILGMEVTLVISEWHRDRLHEEYQRKQLEPEIDTRPRSWQPGMGHPLWLWIWRERDPREPWSRDGLVSYRPRFCEYVAPAQRAACDRWLDQGEGEHVKMPALQGSDHGR